MPSPHATTPNPLSAHARNVTSSDGEDGIIEHIFSVIGTGSTWCVELGALNGTHDSNTRKLIVQDGWSAVLIEGDPTYFDVLRGVYADTGQVVCINEFVSFEGAQSLDRVFSRTPLPQDFDLFVLDIDGNDYHVWDSLKEYRPRVVCVEFNPTIPNSISFIQSRNISVQQGSSLRALAELAAQKGYRLIATTQTNAFFVLANLADSFNLGSDSLDFLHPDTTFHTRLFQLYDGTLVLEGYQSLLWHKQPITAQAIQVLPRWKRRFPAGISPSGLVRMIRYRMRHFPLYRVLSALKKRLFAETHI